MGRTLVERGERGPRRGRHGLRRPRRRQRHRRHGVGPEARRHGLQGPARREGGQRRREDDPAQQGLPDARLRELHLDAEDGGDDPPPEHHGADLQPGRRDPANGRRPVPRLGDAGRRASSTRPPAPAARCARPPARSRCRTSSTPTSSLAAPPTSRSRRPSPRRRSSTGPAARPARTPARPGSRPTATSRSIRSGEYEKAYRLVLEATPLVGTLGRACYAPCEVECTRGSLEGTLPIRRLKRFVSDAHDDRAARRRRRRCRRRHARDQRRPAERPAGRDRRLRADRADRRLAARPQGLRREDLRGRTGARWLPASRDPVLPAPDRRGRARHRERPRPRRRDRDEQPRPRPRRP